MTKQGYLGIDAGTQGLSVVFTDAQLNVVATGMGDYAMLPELEEGSYEQNPQDWLAALNTAMADLFAQLGEVPDVLSIGVSGQMHGEVLTNEHGDPLGPARLWCDSRNADEERELTEALGVKMPKRMTAVRWLWTTRHQPEKARQAKHLITPAGWLAFQLTGEWNLGIGDAAGMFPVDQATLDFDQALLSQYQAMVGDEFPALAELLPTIKKAGESSGCLNEKGAELMGLAKSTPVAAAEGDQPAALAGSLIGQAGMVSVSFGTSVCANSVGDRAFQGVSHAIDHFCAPDGKPINMVFLRNGTTFMNCVVEMFASGTKDVSTKAFDTVMPLVLEADADCGGLLALPFMDDEPGLGVTRGGTAMLVGMNQDNANAGNAVKAALLSTMFNLRQGSEVLDHQGYPRTELVLTGGLTLTPELGQILADVFDTPVKLFESADEGTGWGAAVLAKYRHRCMKDSSLSWEDFLATIESGKTLRFEPRADQHADYNEAYHRYQALLKMHGGLDHALQDQRN